MIDKRKLSIGVIIIAIVLLGNLWLNKFEYNQRYVGEGVEVIDMKELPSDIISMIDNFEVGNFTIVERDDVKYIIVIPYYGTMLLFESVSRDDSTMNIKYRSLFVDESCEPEPLIILIDDYKGKITVLEI